MISNAGERATRRLVWQLEQMRFALTAVWAWAKPDLNKPLQVVVVKDEMSMRALAPQYWERRGAVRPGSLWAGGADRHYLVLRTDVQADDQATVNPYVSAYFSYVGLVIDNSIGVGLPWWVHRGFTGVLSNTIVRDDRILIGPVIPWQLQTVRERTRLQLPKLLAVKRDAPELREASFLEVYDAQTWALVHFLMYGEEGKRAKGFNAFVNMVLDGKDHDTAFAEALGPVQAIDAAFQLYVQRSLFPYQQANVDVSVDRERLPVRQVPPAEAVSARARLMVAMTRPVEARAAIDEARKADPKYADSYAAEGLLLDREEKRAEARAAYEKAAELGTTNAFVYYRLASLAWEPRPTPELTKRLDGLLSKAIEHNVRYGAAYAWLGEIRAINGSAGGIGLIRRAIALEPREATHRLRAANALMRDGKPADARAEAQAALALADSDDLRRDAQQLLERIAKAGGSVP